jgi:hypothetical protein
MKTSNKILLGLLIVIFTVPLLLASSLKSKIKKGEYVVKQNENVQPGSVRTGSFTAYKVVKVVSSNPQLFTCHLTLSDKMDYSYYHVTKEDSVQVYTVSDTLFIKYHTTAATNERGYNKKMVSIHLPVLTNLVVDGAEVIIDSLPASSDSLSVKLKNNGVIQDGSKNNRETTEDISAATVLKNDETVTAKTAQPKTADKSNVTVMRNANSEKLDFKELMIFRLM